MNSADNCPCSQWGVIAAAFLAGALGGAAASALLHQFAYRQDRPAVEVKPRLPQVPPPQAARPEAPQARPGKILIVDDDADFVDLTGAILTQAGYQVATASDSEGAFQQLERDKPDMVLLDVMMRRPLEGLDIARRIAADPNFKAIPIIMASGIAQTEYASEFPADIELPIEAWFSKPVDPTQILNTVQRILSGRA